MGTRQLPHTVHSAHCVHARSLHSRVSSRHFRSINERASSLLGPRPEALRLVRGRVCPQNQPSPSPHAIESTVRCPSPSLTHTVAWGECTGQRQLLYCSVSVSVSNNCLEQRTDVTQGHSRWRHCSESDRLEGAKVAHALSTPVIRSQ